MRKQAQYFLYLYLALIILPYLFAVIRGGDDQVFGGFLLNPMDGNTYLAKMYEGWRGDWRFTLPFTAENGEGAYLFMFYLFLGHLSRITGLSLILIFHIFRLVGAVSLFFSLQAFIEWMFGNKPIWARRALGFVLFGSGLGWLMLPLGMVSSDLWVAESFPFLSGFANPHFAFGMALLLYLFRYLARCSSIQSAVRLAICSLLLSIIMPFGIVIAGCVGGIWLIVEWILTRELKWKQALAAYLPGGLFLVYQYWITLTDPILSRWNVQNLTPSPLAWDFLVAFSPALLLAAWGIWQMLHDHGIGNGQRLLIAWFFTGLVLIYAPFDLQRRFMFGYFIPVGLLAIEGLIRLPGRIKNRQLMVFRLAAALSIITNGVVIMITLFGVLSLAPNYFLTRDEVDGFSYIRTTAPERAIVLCSPEIGNFLPGWTGRKVIYGHEFETINAVQMKKLVEDFYSGEETKKREEEILTENKISYIFVGNREKAIGVPIILSNLLPVYMNGSVSIYAVQ